MRAAHACARWANIAFRSFCSQSSSDVAAASSLGANFSSWTRLASSSLVLTGARQQASSLLSHQASTGVNASLRSKLSQELRQLRGFAAEQSASKSTSDKPPVSLNSLLLFLMGGAGLLYAVGQYKDEKLKQVMTQSQKVVGQASVGGPFQLINQDGKTFTDKDLLGEFALLYFGFTHCPDICPDELEKLAEAIDLVDKWTGVKLQPVFISVDPERDTPALVKQYVKEFHPRMVGLTGDIENIKKTSKSYRVYYSKTGESSTDYLVDHSIIHYLINPAGEFVTFFSKSYTADQMARSLTEHLAAWQKEHSDYHKGRAMKAPEAAAAPAK